MRAMKDSGIPWIGEIPKDWNVSRYKFFATSRMGETILAEDTTESGIPIYSATQDGKIFGYIERPKIILHKDDLVIPARGNSIGCISKVKEDVATCTQTTICSYNIRNINSSFLYHCGWGLKDEWFKYDGSAIPQVTVNQVNSNYLPLPPLAEQQRIAEFLDRKCAEVDEMIALQEQIIEELKAYKQSVITEAVTKGLNPTAPMRDSGIEWIGSIPEHWEVCKLKRKYCLLNGRAYSDNELLAEGKYRILRVGNLFTSNKWYYSDLELEDNKYCSKGDLLYGWSASIGPYLWEEDKVIYHYHIWKVLYAPNNRRYAFYQLQALTDAKKMDMHGSAMQHLTMDNMNNSYIASAPIEEQQAIADYLDEKCADIDSLIQTKQSKIDSLKEYKKSIIYEYVTGKREVNE